MLTLLTVTRALGAVGSAPRSHRGGQEFKSPRVHHRLLLAASSCRLTRSFLCLTGEIACLVQKPQRENAVSIHTVEDNVPWVTGPAARAACLEVTGADALPQVGALVASDAQRLAHISLRRR